MRKRRRKKRDTSTIEEKDGRARGLGFKRLIAVEGKTAESAFLRIENRADYESAVVGNPKVGYGSVMLGLERGGRENGDAALLDDETGVDMEMKMKWE